MKTKKVMAISAALFFVVHLFCVSTAFGAVKAHKVVLVNLTVDSATEATKTIVAHDANSVSYTIVFPKKANVRRGTGDKAAFSEVMADDSITVWGKTVDGVNISPTKVRDNSIRKIRGMYKGSIYSIAPAGLPLPFGASGGIAMVVNGQTFDIVWTFPHTKFKSGKHKITYADFLPGDVISVKGIRRTVSSTPIASYIYNTTEVVVRSHGAVPTSPLIPTALKKF
jgi:hypothetical protein